MGTSITSDRDTAISSVAGRQGGSLTFRLQIRYVGANRYQMRLDAGPRDDAVAHADGDFLGYADSTERSVGAQSYSIRGQLDFEGGPVRIDDVYSGDLGVACDRFGGAAVRRLLLRCRAGSMR